MRPIDHNLFLRSREGSGSAPRQFAYSCSLRCTLLPPFLFFRNQPSLLLLLLPPLVLVPGTSDHPVPTLVKPVRKL